MLLRRISKHVTEQNWFAVFIDFLIVVVGVFIGIQVANWNETIYEQKKEQLITERLKLDFDGLLIKADDALTFHQRNLDGLQTVIETVASGELLPAEIESFKQGLRFSYTHVNSIGRSSTYSEILSSGQLNLIRSEVLRKALNSYDTTVLESAEVFTQIRMHQSAHIKDFTQYFSYEIEATPIIEGKTWQPIGEFDLPSMLNDRLFNNAAHELREAQRFYSSWHLRTRNRVLEVQALLNGINQAEEKN